MIRRVDSRTGAASRGRACCALGTARGGSPRSLPEDIVAALEKTGKGGSR